MTVPPAAQPVNGATTALGVAYRRVRVEQVVPERGIVIVVDEKGISTQVPYRVQPGRGRMPREGDYWYVERVMGPWTLASYIATDDADINSVPGDMTIEGGVLIKKGLYVGDGAHVVGQLHSVTGISTDGGIISTGSITANDGITMPEGKYIIRGPVAAPSFQNGWGNYTGSPGFQTVRFIEYPDGTGGLIGVAAGGTTTTGTTMFSLPVQVRPEGHHTFICAADGGAQAQIKIESGGAVKIQSPDAGISWVALSNCRWPLASAY